MTGEGIVHLLREAFYALPNGSIQERTAYIMRRRAELERGIDNHPVPLRQTIKLDGPGFTQITDDEIDAALFRLTGVKPFHEVANNPAVRHAGDDK